MGASSKKVPSMEVPNWVLRLAALRSPLVKEILAEVGKVKSATNQKAKRVLGWSPRSNEECIISTAQSLEQLGLLKRPGRH